MRRLLLLSLLMTFFFTLFPFPVAASSLAHEIWILETKMQQAENTKNWSEAEKIYQALIPLYTQQQDWINVALMYQRLAQIYYNRKEYDRATEAWDQEAAFWTKVNYLDDAVIARRHANTVRSTIKVFVARSAAAVGDRFYSGTPLEPKTGTYLGAYAERDPAVHDISTWSRFYTEGLPALTGKKHAAYLLYVTWGQPLPFTHFQRARAAGVALQLAVQPLLGLDTVRDNYYLKEFVRSIAATGVPVFIRFAGEMNGDWVRWGGNPALYKEKFRLVAKAIHAGASNAVMVWAPNDFPEKNMDDYYPGDDAVDWIGVSSYSTYETHSDPEGKEDRTSQLDRFADAYQRYSPKKPFMLAETGISHHNYRLDKEIKDWALAQMRRYYAALPRLYPRVKAIFWYDVDEGNLIQETGRLKNNYLLSRDQDILSTYRSMIADPFYLSEIGQEAGQVYLPIEEAGLSTIYIYVSYIKVFDPFVSRVDYEVEGRLVASNQQPPYSASIDFSPWAGQPVKLTVKVYGRDGTMVAQRDIQCAVGSATVNLDGQLLDFDVQPASWGGRLYVPLRRLAESLGAQVTWQPDTRSIRLTRGTDEVILFLDQVQALYNGQSIKLVAPPYLAGDRTMVPLRFLGESFGLTVDYDILKKVAILRSQP
ncbi:MAG: stalk domain-containing protein [Firmicutes bacterium]|nr:stalk domain-containing protein [Bacillota bacterium]